MRDADSVCRHDCRSGSWPQGLLAQLLFLAWWIDGVTSLAIVYFLVKEAREGWSVEEGDDDD
jgi:hypothetical protein